MRNPGSATSSTVSTASINFWSVSRNGWNKHLPRRRYNMTNHVERLKHALNTLEGYTRDGSHKTHRGYTEDGVISLLEGGAVRRPDVSVITRLATSLYQPDVFPIESYTNYDVLPGLLESLQNRFNSWNVLPDLSANIALTNGSTQALNAFLNSICSARDTILTVQGFYHPFAAITHRNNINMACVPTHVGNNYKLTAQGLTSFLATQTGTKPKAILFTNPSPFGVCYTLPELQALAAVIQKHNLMVYEDAVFKDTEHNTPTTLLASVPGMESHVVIASSLSKSLNCANIRLGWACGPQFVINRMVSYMRDESITVSQFNQIAAASALNMPAEFIQGNINEIKTRVALVASLVQGINTRLAQTYPARGNTPFMAIEVTPESGHSILISFDGLVGCKLPNGTTIKDDLDITAYLLGFGVGVSPTYSCGFINRCCVRLALAEVDTTPVHAATRNHELHHGIQSLLQLAAPAQAQTIWNTLAPMLGTQVPAHTVDADVQHAFHTVQNVLKDIFENRIFTALDQLLQANSPNLSRSAHEAA
ncbi:MAG: pyridoxal phosphate-dependent aminotransferase [Alphaproteobacteria bacterium]|nr:MAG: pyridoxal phosphate-dependent aminotransferase [Alphaproteobacteria bacterium]